MNKNQIEIFGNISNQLNGTIKKIMSIKYHYDLDEIFSAMDNLSKKSQNSIYETLINNYLTLIINSIDLDIINDEEAQGDILDFFSERITTKTANEQYRKRVISIEIESEYITRDLVSKLTLKSESKIKLPIKLDDIREFCISYEIDNKDINLVIQRIILNLAIIYNLLLDKRKLSKNNSH